jgi:hypothetical protein
MSDLSPLCAKTDSADYCRFMGSSLGLIRHAVVMNEHQKRGPLARLCEKSRQLAGIRGSSS